MTTTEFTPEGSKASIAVTKLLANPEVSTVPVNVTVCVGKKNNETRQEIQSVSQSINQTNNRTKENGSSCSSNNQ